MGECAPEMNQAQISKEQDKVKVVTFGCRLNDYESEVIKQNALKAGLENVIVVNTCAVTSEAERQSRQEIRKLRRAHPDAKIIATGCAVQINQDKYAQMPEVDSVIGNHEKMLPETYLKFETTPILVTDILTIKETTPQLISGFDGKTRAFIQVQNGCNHRCTFCTIPLGRGNSRSVPIGQISQQVKTLCENGFLEIVLTGVDITSYGHDLPGVPSLGQMIRRILALHPNLARVRLSSIDPMEIDDDLWRLIEQEPRFMPHLHLSVQAGDDMILKRMKRRHLRQDVIDVCQRAKSLRPDIIFGADIIAGFPTETDQMFENSLKLLDECDLTWLHVFPYSERDDTPAARMPQVQKSVRKERAKLLRQKAQQKVQDYFVTCVGKEFEVLMESEKMGHTPQFAKVKIAQDGTDLAGQRRLVKITGYDQDSLLGHLI